MEDILTKIISKLTKQRDINAAEQKLVDALRSGKYRQIRSQLFDGTGYCCLGVACEISKIDKFVQIDGTPAYLNERFILPQKVRQKLGWASLSGILKEPVEAIVSNGQILTFKQLTRLNDLGILFEDIATIVELGYVLKTEL